MLLCIQFDQFLSIIIIMVPFPTLPCLTKLPESSRSRQLSATSAPLCPSPKGRLNSQSYRITASLHTFASYLIPMLRPVVRTQTRRALSSSYRLACFVCSLSHSTFASTFACPTSLAYRYCFFVLKVYMIYDLATVLTSILLPTLDRPALH